MLIRYLLIISWFSLRPMLCLSKDGHIMTSLTMYISALCSDLPNTICCSSSENVTPVYSRIVHELHALLQGAAWLQSQATSAAALSASTDLPMSSAAAITPSKSSHLPGSLGKHRRHASTSPFTLPDQDFSSSPLSRGNSEAAASPMHKKADKPSANSIAFSTAANDTSARLASMTGQESLQKATVALKELQTKYGQASSKAQSSSNSSSFSGVTQEVSSGLGSAADTEDDSVALGSAAAFCSSRSSFDFGSAVGLRKAARGARGADPSSSRGAHLGISGVAHPSSARGTDPSSSGGAHPSTSEGAQPGSSGGAHPSSSGRMDPSGSEGPHPNSSGMDPSGSERPHPSSSADKLSHTGSSGS